MFGKKNEEVFEPDMIQNDVVEGVTQELESDEEFSSEENTHAAVKSLKPSVISEGFEFIGEIKTAGSLTVEGSIVGKVSVDHLIVGVAGVVDGTLEAKTIIVKGRLSGDITCSDITVCGRSSVDGKLTYSSITIQRGGSIKGDLKKVT
jgi:cytoskeletal protein CcmA (bactofilin family)